MVVWKEETKSLFLYSLQPLIKHLHLSSQSTTMSPSSLSSLPSPTSLSIPLLRDWVIRCEISSLTINHLITYQKQQEGEARDMREPEMVEDDDVNDGMVVVRKRKEMSLLVGCENGEIVKLHHVMS